MMITLSQVALGGAIGSLLRHLCNLAALRLVGPGVPVATLVVNVLGCFLMGIAVALLARLDAMRLSPLVMTGVLGGFTTFSAYALDAVTLYERGDAVVAAGYVIGTVVLSLAALLAGLFLVRGWPA